MRYRRPLALISVLAASVLVAAGCGSDDESSSSSSSKSETTTTAAEKMEDSKNIVETAVGAGNFETLVKAVTAADLVETLSGEGPFTVFAPTDDAFAKVDEATIATLLEPANKDLLTKVLTYHVVADKAMAGDLKDGQMLTTVNGEKLKVTIKPDGTVMIGDAVVSQPDIEASNGVIHVIDSVLLPPGAGEAVAAAQQ